MPMGIEAQGAQSYTILEYDEDSDDFDENGSSENHGARNMMICVGVVLFVSVSIGISMSLRFTGSRSPSAFFTGHHEHSGGSGLTNSNLAGGSTNSDSISNVWSNFQNYFADNSSSGGSSWSLNNYSSGRKSANSRFLARRDEEAN